MPSSLKTGRPRIALSPAHIKLKNNVKGAPAPKNRIADPAVWENVIKSNELVVITFKQVGCAGCGPFETRVMSKTDKKFKSVPRIDIELVHDKKDPAEKLADRYSVETTPAAIVLKNGSEVGRVDSYGLYDRDFEAITRILEKYA